MIKCPHCGGENDTIYINAPAVIEYLCEVGAEVNLEELQNVKEDSNGNRYLPTFRLDEILERTEHLDHNSLELDGDKVTYYCLNCDGELPKELVIT